MKVHDKILKNISANQVHESKERRTYQHQLELTEDSESRRPTVGEEQYRREKWGIGMNAVLLELVVAMRLFLRQIWRKNDR